MKRIYDLFISSEAEHELNLVIETKQDVEKKIKNKEIKIEIFDKVKEEVFMLMRKDSYTKFVINPMGKETFKQYQRIKSFSATFINNINNNNNNNNNNK